MTNVGPQDIVRETIQTSWERIGQELEHAERAIRNLAGGKPLPERIACAVGTAAGRIQRAAHYVGEHKTEELMDDARGAVRRAPGPSLLIAAGAGLALGWMMRK